MKRITKIEASGTLKAKKLRVAAYARVSTDSAEQLISLEAQKQHYESYIKARKDWEFAGLYYDEGISGTKMAKREGLLSLLDDCEKDLIDYIIVKSISRFSRNAVDSIETVRKLCQMGIFIFFEKENIDTGKMEGELLLSILSSLAESESRSIAENNYWSIQKRFKNGTYKISYTPYGYRNDNGTMVIDETEAEVVRWIFAQLLSGSSSNQIARELNAKGVPTKRGGIWRPTVINGMVRNEKYVGDVIFQKTFTDSQFNRHVNYGERTQYMVQDHHAAIISRVDFEAANEILERNGKEKGINGVNCNNRYAFSGKIICGECGEKWKRKKMDYGFAYACSGHIKDKNACSQMSIPEEKIKDAFITMMNKLTFARSTILIPLLEQISSIEGTGAVVRLQEINDALDAITVKRTQVNQLFTKGYLDPPVYAQTNVELNEKEERLRAEKNLIIQKSQGDASERISLEALIKQTAKGIMLTEFSDKTFTEFVDHIIIYSRTELGFAMKCGPIFRERI